MDAFSLENIKNDLKKSLPPQTSKTKLIKLYNFYNILLDSKNQSLIEAYIFEFMDDYFDSLKSYSPFCSNPKLTQALLDQIEQLLQLNSVLTLYTELNDIKIKIKSEYYDLTEFLNGSTFSGSRKQLCFPVLEKSDMGKKYPILGSIENIIIEIKKNTHLKFVFVPNNGSQDDSLLAQTVIAYNLSKNFLLDKRHKIDPYHEIFIYFKNSRAIYEGDSLGIALTIGLIEALSAYHNLPYTIASRNDVVYTGSFDIMGKVTPLSEDYIERKVDLIFYSFFNFFVIPKGNEKAAVERLNTLLEIYPKRKLELIPVGSLADLLNRRNIVEIKKQSVFLRSARYLKKNWVSSFLLLIIFFFTIYILERDFNTSPEKIEVTDDGFDICNKNGKVLWTIKQSLARSQYLLTRNLNAIEIKIRLIDLNSDNVNEVLYCFDPGSTYSDDTYSSGIAVLDNNGKVVSKYSFKYSVFSNREIIEPPYGLNLYDTITYKGYKCIITSANNQNSYASSLFIFNPLLNRVVSDTLWNSGHFVDARIVNFDEDDINEIITLGFNNGFQKAQLASISLTNFKGQIPTTGDYLLKGIPTTHLNYCLLIPNTDYGTYLNNGSTGLRHRGLMIEEDINSIRFIGLVGGSINPKHIIFSYHYDIGDLSCHIGNDFRFTRDSLVSLNILSPPYTDTKEYRKILRDSTKIWSTDKFVFLK